MVTDIFTTEKKYNVIYADPPWEYKQSGSAKNGRGMAKTTLPDNADRRYMRPARAADMYRRRALLYVGNVSEYRGSLKSYGVLGLYIQDGGVCVGKEKQMRL